MDFSQVRWKKVSFAIAIGVIDVFWATTAYANWKWEQGVCVNFNPDGSEEMIYGKDCGETFESLPITTQGENI